MKLIRFISTGVLLVLFGAVAPAFARQQHDRGQGGGRGRYENGGGNRHADNGRQPQRFQPQERARQQQETWNRRPGSDRARREVFRPEPRRSQPAFRPVEQAPRGRGNGNSNLWMSYRANSWASEHRDWRARGGYHGYFIPRDRFSVYFGPRHYFRVQRLPVIVVGGYPRFQYGGYWFALVDPWPEYWANDWYYRDDVYIDYFGDGYYLFNRRYPDTRIAVNIFVD